MQTLSRVVFSLVRIAAGALMVGACGQGTCANVIIDWNAAIVGDLNTEAGDRRVPGERARILALAHRAMFDALRLVARESGKAIPADASYTAAAATAARDVLQTLMPAHAPTWRALWQVHCQEPDGEGNGAYAIRVGATVAKKTMSDPAAVALDGSAYQPMLLQRADQFQAQPPYEIELSGAIVPSFRDRREFSELVQRVDGTDKELLVAFWREHPECTWNRLACDLVAREKIEVLATARLFAALNTALTDASIAAAESARFFGVQRKTVAPLRTPSSGPQASAYGAWDEDRTWNQTVEAEIVLPPLSGYPSQTAVMAGAAAAVLEWQFGRRVQSFVLKSADNHADGEAAISSRSFSSFTTAARECSMARVLAGQDFIEAGVAGYDLGWVVGRWIARRDCFRPGSRR